MDLMKLIELEQLWAIDGTRALVYDKEQEN